MERGGPKGSPSQAVSRLAIILTLLPALASCGSASGLATGRGMTTDGGLRIQRGSFQRKFLLTGEIATAKSVPISAPNTWRMTLKWLIEDGSAVKKGDRIAEVDTGEVASAYEKLKTGAESAVHELERTIATAEAELLGLRSQAETARIDLDKAALDAKIPEEIISRLEQGEHELAFLKARLSAAKARDDVAKQRTDGRSDREIQTLALQKKRNQLEEVESAMRQRILTTPVDGIAIVATHYWLHRKLHEGDTIFRFWTLAEIPDLSSIQVTARLADVDEGRIAVSDRAEIRLDAFHGRVFHGRIEKIDRVAKEIEPDSLRRFFKVSVSVEDADPEILVPGQSAQVLVFGKTIPDALLVPRIAIDLADPESPKLLLGVLNNYANTSVPIDLGECDSRHCVAKKLPPGVTVGTKLRGRRP